VRRHGLEQMKISRTPRDERVWDPLMVMTMDEAVRGVPSAFVGVRDSSGRSHLGSAPSSSSGYDCCRLALASVRGRVSGMPWAMKRVHLEEP